MAPLGDNLQYAHLLEMGGTNSPQVSIIIQIREAAVAQVWYFLQLQNNLPKQPTFKKNKSTYEKPSVPLLTRIL